MNQQAGKYIIIFGIAIIAIGLTIYFLPNAFKWFGRLPGDIRVDKENFKFYFPITTMILLSLLLTLILNVLKKL
jgi:hypothetical protein